MPIIVICTLDSTCSFVTFTNIFAEKTNHQTNEKKVNDVIYLKTKVVYIPQLVCCMRGLVEAAGRFGSPDRIGRTTSWLFYIFVGMQCVHAWWHCCMHDVLACLYMLIDHVFPRKRPKPINGAVRERRPSQGIRQGLTCATRQARRHVAAMQRSSRSVWAAVYVPARPRIMCLTLTCGLHSITGLLDHANIDRSVGNLLMRRSTYIQYDMHDDEDAWSKTS